MCYVFSTQNNSCEFLPSDGVTLQSEHQSCLNAVLKNKRVSEAFDKEQKVKVQRCKGIFKRLSGYQYKHFYFSDENFFNFQQIYNQ